jgi:hypothetical protein
MCIKEVLGDPSSGLLGRRPWFDFRLFCMQFVMAKVTFELVFAFRVIASFHQCSILVFGFIRLLLERNGRSLGTFEQNISLSLIVEQWAEKYIDITYLSRQFLSVRVCRCGSALCAVLGFGVSGVVCHGVGKHDLNCCG